ncbi:CapA family protein [Actinomadura barringtoniae]|uniref:CapA family protein n=1 Tax=Actinomadura barringtoniae TaxID=1427535 RepID=A0A939PMR0_9ACTN|nr:CapA family protein [Actinomadura barringtoniae]MBO2452744.1 CapA family protein [Actinomadura barringtoniae]
MRTLPAAAMAALTLAALASGCQDDSEHVSSRNAGGHGGLPAATAVPPAAPSSGLPGGLPPAASAQPRVPGTFTVAASGDVLLHDSVSRQARLDGGGQRDYRAILASVKPVISSADLAICHLETPLAPPRGPFSGYPAFSVPQEIAPALADLGYDTCSTASNHTLDKGAAGVDRTLNVLDRAGIAHTGSARNAAEAARPDILRVGPEKVPVAQLSYAYGFNGYKIPKDKPWLTNQISGARILADAKRARMAGAKVVIVSMHWGREYEHKPTAGQIQLARKLLASRDIDLIIGHHVHVVQPFGRATNGKWVAYGLGNLIASQGPNAGDKHEGMVARFTFARSGARWKVTRAEMVPTLIDPGPPFRLVDVTASLADPNLDGPRRQQLNAVLQRTYAVARSRGAAVTLAR